MAASGYARALPRVLVHEGNYVNDPRDPGGATNKGITHRVYDAYRTRKGQPTKDVREISPGEVSEIYRLQYWQVVCGDELPSGLDYVLFDGAVNSGPSQSVKWLQRALGNVAVDGQMGQATLAAVAEYDDTVHLIDRVCDRRMAFLKALRTWPTFGKGWTRRVDSVRTAGKAWAQGHGHQMPLDVPATKKARPSDAKTMPGKGAADAATGGGIASGGLGTVLETMRQSLEPYAYALPWVGHVIVGLILVGALLTAGGLVYRWYAARKAKELADALDLPGVAA